MSRSLRVWIAAALFLVVSAAPSPRPAAAQEPAAPGGLPPPAIEPLLDSVVDALHAGDYSHARERLGRTRELAPEDAGVLLMQAYVAAWQGAHDFAALADDAHLRSLLERVQELGEARRSGAPDEGRLAYYSGLASFMLARLQYSDEQRSLWRAASNTRRGMRALERAVELGYEPADASFWTGAYHTIAGALPAPLRALKTLIGLPGGNREEGLAELERAANEGRRFRLEARLFLAGTLADPHHPGFDRGLQVLLDMLPEVRQRGSLLPAFTAELLAEWGLTPQALSLWDGILERRALDPRLYSGAELGRVRLGAARALFGEMRWAEAAGYLEPFVDPAPTAPERMRERGLMLLARCRARQGERAGLLELVERTNLSERALKRLTLLLNSRLPEVVPEREISAALEVWKLHGPRQALPLLEDFVRRHPQHRVGLLHAGRAAFQAARIDDSVRTFRSLLDLRDGRAPEEAAGWAWLYLGWAADLGGRREEALLHYRHAARLDEFEARRAGNLFAEVPYQRLPAREADVWVFLERRPEGKADGAAGRPQP